MDGCWVVGQLIKIKLRVKVDCTGKAGVVAPLGQRGEGLARMGGCLEAWQRWHLCAHKMLGIFGSLWTVWIVMASSSKGLIMIGLKWRRGKQGMACLQVGRWEGWLRTPR